MRYRVLEYVLEQESRGGGWKEQLGRCFADARPFYRIIGGFQWSSQAAGDLEAEVSLQGISLEDVEVDVNDGCDEAEQTYEDLENGLLPDHEHEDREETRYAFVN